MDVRPIVSYLLDAVLGLELDGVSENSIATANVEFASNGLDLWFEIYVDAGETFAETETSATTAVSGTIVICVSRGEGAARATAISSALVDAFALYNPNRRGGLRWIQNVVEKFGAKKIVDCRVDGVRATPGGEYDEHYKTSVKIDFDCLYYRPLDFFNSPPHNLR